MNRTVTLTIEEAQEIQAALARVCQYKISSLSMETACTECGGTMGCHYLNCTVMRLHWLLSKLQNT